jgi:predicted RNA binding protein YcfA (HicA-like mRNA interferase family)
MPAKPPAITGKQLIRLLTKGGWTPGRRTRHGISFARRFPDGRARVTVVPDKRSSLPDGTLADILGPTQTGIGREGLSELIQAHGIK